MPMTTTMHRGPIGASPSQLPCYAAKAIWQKVQFFFNINYTYSHISVNSQQVKSHQSHTGVSCCLLVVINTIASHSHDLCTSFCILHTATFCRHEMQSSISGASVWQSYAISKTTMPTMVSLCHVWRHHHGNIIWSFSSSAFPLP